MLKLLAAPKFAWSIVALLVAGGILGYWFVSQPTSNLPESVRSSLDFTPLIVDQKNKDYSTNDYKSSTAEDNVKILSYIIKTPTGPVSVSQYVQPPAFTDIPEYKDRFLDNIIKRYASVQTAGGTIYLGRASKQNNKQLGVMLERGLIVFFSPDIELSETDWRKLGDQMIVSR